MRSLLIADVHLYSTEEGGRNVAVLPGWGCPRAPRNDEQISTAYDGWAQLGDTPMAPGDTRRFGLVFLSGEEAATVLREAGEFYLWEGRFIGKARLVSSPVDTRDR